VSSKLSSGSGRHDGGGAEADRLETNQDFLWLANLRGYEQEAVTRFARAHTLRKALVGRPLSGNERLVNAYMLL